MRRSVNKRKGARSFRKQIRKTKGINLAKPTRGGYRL